MDSVEPRNLPNLSDRQESPGHLQSWLQGHRGPIDSLLEGVHVIDDEWRFAYLNGTAAFHWRSTVKDLLGRRLTDCFSGIETTLVFEELSRCMLDRVSSRFEAGIAYHDDTEGWFDFSVQPVSEGLLVLSLDASERRRSQAERDLFHSLLAQLMENIPDYVYFKDLDSKFILASRSLAVAYGLQDASQIVGSSDSAFYSRERAASAFEDEQIVLREGTPIVNKEEHTRWPDGHASWILTTKLPFRDGQGATIGTFGISRDISGLKATEDQLRRRVAELEAVNHISAAMRPTHTLETLLPALLETSLRVMELSYGAIWLHDPFDNEFRLASAIGYEENGLLPLLSAEGLPDGVAGVAFATGGPAERPRRGTDRDGGKAVGPPVASGTSSVAVALRAANEVTIGAVCVGAIAPRSIDEDDLRFLTTVSEIAGNAIQRVRLHEQTERRLRQVSALREIDRAITTSFDLRRNLDTVLAQVVSLLKADAALIFRLDNVSGRLEPAASVGFANGAAVVAFQVRLGSGVAGRAAFERRTIFIADIRADPRSSNLVSLDGGTFVSSVCTPLITKGSVNGVLEVLQRSSLRPSGEWLEVFESIGGQAAIVVENSVLYENALRSRDDLTMAYDATIEGWSRALDLRDKETEGHTQRVTNLTVRLARAYGMSEEDLARVRWGSLLHDIGKMGVPDAILLKPGPLTDEEWSVMRRHPTLAFEMLAPITYLKDAIDIPYCHHEKWDGTGYPRGLKGDHIPIAARLFAVVDVWDALTSDRPYRPAWSAERTREHIEGLSGTHFDPQAVRIFLEVLGETEGRGQA